MIDTQGLKNIVEESKDYLDSQMELTKIKVAEKSSRGISTLMVILIVGSTALLTFICFSLFMGFLLAEHYNSNSIGFGIITGIYIFLLALLFLFRKKLLLIPIQNKVIKEFFKDE